jgi:hypothetical protein
MTFLSKFIRRNETWVYGHGTERKQQFSVEKFFISMPEEGLADLLEYQ